MPWRQLSRGGAVPVLKRPCRPRPRFRKATRRGPRYRGTRETAIAVPGTRLADGAPTVHDGLDLAQFSLLAMRLPSVAGSRESRPSLSMHCFGSLAYVVPVAAMPFPCVGTTRSRATILVSRSTEIAKSSSAIPLGTSVMFTATTVGNLPYRTDGVPGWGHKDSRVGRFEWVPEMRILPAVRPSTPGVEAVAWPPIRGSQPQSSAPCPV